MSAASLADPKNATLAAQANTLFKGETLRGLLLNAWGWSQVGLCAIYAAVALTIATVAVFCALVFQLLVVLVPARATRPRPIPA
jgi:hypothetical protein